MRIRAYQCSTDPSILGVNYGPTADRRGSSYPANAQVFTGQPNWNRTFRDGLSTTITFAEHYARCSGVLFDTGVAFNMGDTMRRPSFADREPNPYPFLPTMNDVVPVTAGSPPVSRASTPGLTFQVRPQLGDCDSKIPQTPHPGGMPTLFGDGSVRIVRPSVAEEVFWAAVTPAGGEVVSLD